MIDDDGRPGRAPIPYDEIARLPQPGAGVPVQIAFGPGQRVLTYLYSPDGDLDRRLFALHLGDPRAEPQEVQVDGASLEEAGLPIEEQLRRERAREVGTGITSASWAEDADVLLVPLPDGLRVVSGLSLHPPRVASKLVVALDPGVSPLLSPRLSPDGTKVAFVQDGDLYVASTSDEGERRRLTATATDGLTNGLAEFVAQEEMGRPEGFWWSRDSGRLAYAEVDERQVPLYRIVHQGSDQVGADAEETHRYPFAGKANALVRLGVVSASGGETTWMDLGGVDQYLARVHWLHDGHLVAELETRDQTRVDVTSFDSATGRPTVLHVETTEPYVNLHDDFCELSDGSWLWSSERTGFRHLETRSRSGELVRVLTAGEWQVDRLETVDEELGVVFFTATKDGPTERHLYSVPLTGGEIRRVTKEPGTHVVVVAKSGGVYVDRHGALDTPPTVRLRSSTDGALIATLHERRDPRIDSLGLGPPELVSFPAADGTALMGLLYRPESQPGTLPPLVVHVYGGPHVQIAVNDWVPTMTMRAQALRRLGFTVLAVDNRGSARRGLAFESALWQKMGGVEVADQVSAVAWAVSEGLADSHRVGIYGWSYGGYMTLQCLAQAADTFCAGVAGAPVTHWDGYDTHYTERYMGTPQSNPAGYESSSVFAHVGSMRGELLLVHGLIDENVHFRHTARLINRLVAAGKSYDLLCFPEERHLPRREEDRAFMEEHVIGWLTRALSPTNLAQETGGKR
ncbi:MAG: S9 family peptidase [Acidimicrobiales bacterium]